MEAHELRLEIVSSIELMAKRKVSMDADCAISVCVCVFECEVSAPTCDSRHRMNSGLRSMEVGMGMNAPSEQEMKFNVSN